MLKLRDLLWLLAYPFYQIISTFRHEGAHAMIALLGGGEITKFVFWPSMYKEKFYWGYVICKGAKGWLFFAAPYLLDFLTFSAFFILCMGVIFKRRWIWLNLVIIGMLSPLVNSFYNYWGGFQSMNDVGKLFRDLPAGIVHWYFILTLSAYLVGLAVVFLFSRTSQFHRRRPAAE
jgi:hypothetical protein